METGRIVWERGRIVARVSRTVDTEDQGADLVDRIADRDVRTVDKVKLTTESSERIVDRGVQAGWTGTVSEEMILAPGRQDPDRTGFSGRTPGVYSWGTAKLVLSTQTNVSNLILLQFYPKRI